MLKVERIVTGGDGIARASDGRIVFIPRTAPEEQVEVQYTEEHKQWFRARLVRVVEPSPFRREPPCPYYAECGGCQLQHLQYGAQLSAKSAIVADSLRRLGRVEVAAPQVVPSPHEFGYRNRITYLLRRHGGRTAIGYHALDDPSRLVEVDRCPLAEDPINDARASLAKALERLGEHVPEHHEWRLTFRVSSDSSVGLSIEGPDRPRDIERAVTQSLVDGGLSALWMINDQGRIIAHAGATTLSERWGAYEIPLAGTAFVQVNRDGAEKLDPYVLEQCRIASGMSFVDAYCGFGLRSFEIARLGATVVGIDSDRHAVGTAMVIAAEKNLAARFIADRVESSLPGELPAGTVILNPPRSGIAPETVGALLTAPPDRIVYVSCNPATLARDLKNLSGVYVVEACRAFDLFPQTSHVETVVTLNRTG
jgi:23S rRNA (uracil1939-C5)-methyltransferase